METEAWVELIKILPGILRLLFIGIVFSLFYKPLKNELIPRLVGLKIPGLELAFLEEELNRVVIQQADMITHNDRANILKRAQRAAPLLRGAKILWVSNGLGVNASEHRMIHSLGIFLDIAQSTKEALDMLNTRRYDAVISDDLYHFNSENGDCFIKAMKKINVYRPTIIYTSNNQDSKTVSDDVFAVASRADHLVHFIIDIMERERL